jgi:hypothetical protein
MKAGPNQSLHLTGSAAWPPLSHQLIRILRFRFNDPLMTQRIAILITAKITCFVM